MVILVTHVMLHVQRVLLDQITIVYHVPHLDNLIIMIKAQIHV